MMKKMSLILAAVLLMTLLWVPSLAETEKGIIRVTGNATISLAPAQATLQLGVETRSATVREAQKENAMLMNAVLEALREMKVEDKDIVTSNFNVYSSFEYKTDEKGNDIRIPVYFVQNMLNVTIRDLNQLGAVLDAAMEAGANTTYGITFSSTEANEAYFKALTRAVEDAAKKANILAAAAGKTLGNLKLMDATQQVYNYGISNVYRAAKGEEAMDAGTSIVSGDVTVNASVTMEYEFD